MTYMVLVSSWALCAIISLSVAWASFPCHKAVQAPVRTDDLYLWIVQLSNEALKADLFLVYARQQRLMVTCDIVTSFWHEMLNLFRILTGTDGLYNLLLAAPCLYHDLDADRAWLVGFLAYKHGAKLTRDTQFYIFSKDFLLEISYSQILSKLGGENRRLIEHKECFQEKIVMLFICGISVAWR